MMTVGEFWTQVALYRRAVAGSVTSGGRSPARNARVGGVPNSPHLLDLGADVVHDGETHEDRRDIIARGFGLKLVVESDHDHLQPLDWDQRVAATPERA